MSFLCICLWDIFSSVLLGWENTFVLFRMFLWPPLCQLYIDSFSASSYGCGVTLALFRIFIVVCAWFFIYPYKGCRVMLVLFRTLYTHQCVSVCIFFFTQSCYVHIFHHYYPQNLVAGNKIITNVLANRNVVVRTWSIFTNYWTNRMKVGVVKWDELNESDEFEVMNKMRRPCSPNAKGDQKCLTKHWVVVCAESAISGQPL